MLYFPVSGRAVVDESEGSAVASATTTDIWVLDGTTLHITGTTTITSFGTAPRVGAWRKVIFDGILTLTDGANLNLPGGANIPTAADDFAFVYAETTTLFKVLYFPVSGKAVVAGVTKEFFVPVTAWQSSATAKLMGIKGDFPAAPLRTSTDEAFIAFFVPADFTTIVNAVIIVSPASTQAAADWDITSDYAAAGEAFNANSESDTASTYNVTNNILFEVDISGILSALAASDYVGVQIDSGNNAHDLDVIGIRFKYS